ncbi:hypothetical protein BDB01DRAFT_770277 [Pilobolus umbonatus]|nr:hypothetical protein BDB01DRAFT_770277 [Pilobolus umbonatus]
MTQSLNTALPSIHFTAKNVKSATKDTPSCVPKQQFKVRNHIRTASLPLHLPSHEQPKHQRLSMDVLLDAIDLDQQMRKYFKAEVLKVKSRTTYNATMFKPTQSTLMARRRSKSAPGAPPSYHQQRAFNSRWTTPNQNNTVTSASAAQEVAQLIVQQHFASVKKR